MNDLSDEEILEAIDSFPLKGKLIKFKPWGNGHINDTYCLWTKDNDKEIRYILQRMNTNVFKNPDELMENILGVTSHLKNKIIARGGDSLRETMNVIKTKDLKPYFKNKNNKCFRIYTFVENATSYDLPKNKDDFYESAKAFGNFQSLLSDYPASTLHETIPNFHNTKDRFNKFKEALEKDIMGRKNSCLKEIQFILAREDDALFFQNLIDNNMLPIRVTHNDTKLNNIMMDNETNKGICVIDLDTTMPGLAMNDFGDSIRFGASTASEDELNLDKVECNLDLFEAYTKGFIEGCDGKLTKKEIELLPMGAKVMTFECGMRFLTDYLEGDTYFKIHRPKHNLDRCRTQLKLVSDYEKKWELMNKIVNKYI